MDTVTKPTLLSQTLNLINNHETKIARLDLRNAILFHVVNFVHKNANVTVVRNNDKNETIRTINPQEQGVVENLMAILLNGRIKNKIEFIQRITLILQQLSNVDLKASILNVLENNHEFEVNPTERTLNNSNPSKKLKSEEGYCPIYKKPSGVSNSIVCFKMITARDLNKPTKVNILSSKYFKLWLIKEVYTTYELYITQIACILHDNPYKLRMAGRKLAIEFIPNAVIQDSNPSNRRIEKHSMIKTLIIKALLHNIDEKLDNFVQDNNKQCVPIDFGVSLDYDTPEISYTKGDLSRAAKYEGTSPIMLRFPTLIRYIKDNISYREIFQENLSRSILGLIQLDEKYLKRIKVTCEEIDNAINDIFTTERMAKLNQIVENIERDSGVKDSMEINKVLNNIHNVEMLINQKRSTQ